jgi:hypothetical protein
MKASKKATQGMSWRKGICRMRSTRNEEKASAMTPKSAASGGKPRRRRKRNRPKPARIVCTTVVAPRPSTMPKSA